MKKAAKITIENPDSPLIQFIRVLWNESMRATGHSWTRLNGALRQAVNIAITADVPMAIGDVELLLSRFRATYWACIESWYTAAVAAGNSSAYHAIEHYLGRKPFIYDGKRLAVGSNLAVERGTYQFTVSSFNDKNGVLNAIQTDYDSETQTRSVKRRKVLTPEQVRELSKQFHPPKAKPKKPDSDAEDESGTAEATTEESSAA